MEEDQLLMQQLKLLIAQLSSDLSAIALLDPNNRIRWKYISGNSNDRYRHMVKKPGFGLAGQIIRYGRTIIIDRMHPNTEILNGQYPLMLSERLQSVIAMPLYLDSRIFGVLLVGDRRERIYSLLDVQYVEEAREHIISVIPSELIHHSLLRKNP